MDIEDVSDDTWKENRMAEVSAQEETALMRVSEQLRFDVPNGESCPDSMSWKALHEHKKQCNVGLNVILDTAEAREGCDLTQDENRAITALKGYRYNYEREMKKRMDAGTKAPMTSHRHQMGGPSPFGGFASTPSSMPVPGMRAQSQGAVGGMMLVSRESGRRMPVYAGTAPMTESFGDASVGQLACAIAAGDLSGLDVSMQGAVTGAGDGGGSYMLNSQVSGRVVDLARSASVVMRAGALTVPMDTSEMTLLRVLSDPSVTARREMQAVNGTAPTFGKFTLAARMYSAIVPITMEQLEDAANAASVIEDTMRSALGLAMDRAILSGAGGAEVLGITNAEGTNEQTTVGTPSDWSEVSQAVGSIMGANYDGEPSNLAWIHNPRDGGTYDRLVAGDNQPLRPSPWAGALNRLTTTSLAPDGSETDMIVGDFSQVLVGMRYGGVVFDVVDSGQLTVDGEEVNAAAQFVRFLRARIRFDAVLMRPDWFTVLRGVTDGS